MSRVIIGLTGAFGSGASFLADNFFMLKRGFEKFSLSQVLKEKFKQEYGKDYENRNELQEYGNKIRKEDPEALAKIIDKKISSKTNQKKNIIIDSIRNPAEIFYFRNKYPEFILIGVFADYAVRWERVKDVYNNKKDDFDQDERKDQGKSEPGYGQKVSDCFFESDLIILNNEPINTENPNDEYKGMDSKIQAYLDDYNNPFQSEPTRSATLMALAYTNGRSSACLKRKVGSVIVDKYGKVLSAGCNQVPKNLSECKNEHGSCYRDKKRKELAKNISAALGCECTEDVINKVKQRIKVLELCRAMHAEESAIMSLVGKGVDLEGSQMYVTTYPCNLCANKIVQAGIKKVVYFEPYPVQEAKEILEKGKVETEAFEGVTFRAFFRFYKYQP